MKRAGIKPPKFAEKFFRLDFEAEPLPVLCLYPVPPAVSLDELRLEVAGLEQHPRAISWAALRELPRVTLKAPLICQIFNWAEVVEWEGVRLVDVLDFLKIETHPEGYYAFHSRDGLFFETLSRDEARDPRVLMATGLSGMPLPALHGGPVRLVVPFLQGYKSVKWVGTITAFRHDPVGIKRLLGQSLNGRLNDDWTKRFGIAPPAGKAGDPPGLAASAPADSPKPTGERSSSPILAGKVDRASEPNKTQRPRGDAERALLREIIAIVRPAKRLATRQALEAAGIVAYTAYGVLGRSRQRGLRFRPGKDGDGAEAAIKFLPKLLFSVIVEARQVPAAVQSIIKANRTGQGQYGDGKIALLDVEDAVRISTDERGQEALS